jgi:hypothetical protein
MKVISRFSRKYFTSRLNILIEITGSELFKYI